MTPLPALDPLPLPAPAWLLSALLSLTFFLHVLPMNLLLGGSIIALVARLRGRKDGRSAALAREIAGVLPVLFAATLTLGVAALLFLQVLYGRAFFSAAVLLAVPWFLVVPAAHHGLLRGVRHPKPEDARLARRPWIASRSAFCVVFVAFVQANVMSAVLHPVRLVSWFAAARTACASTWAIRRWRPASSTSSSARVRWPASRWQSPAISSGRRTRNCRPGWSSRARCGSSRRPRSTSCSASGGWRLCRCRRCCCSWDASRRQRPGSSWGSWRRSPRSAT